MRAIPISKRILEGLNFLLKVYGSFDIEIIIIKKKIIIPIIIHSIFSGIPKRYNQFSISKPKIYIPYVVEKDINSESMLPTMPLSANTFDKTLLIKKKIIKNIVIYITVDIPPIEYNMLSSQAAALTKFIIKMASIIPSIPLSFMEEIC